MNVTLMAGVPVELYAETGYLIGTQLKVSSNTDTPIKLSTSFVGLDEDSVILPAYKQATNKAGDAEAWAECHRTVILNVREA